ncbi:MAG: tRNA (cytidine(34)-2'-O)-methyltransferase [Desulfatiglandaceae bacterium]|jgi:tRNA (cytidine/uridine-2'-O-)-methyltransferase
MPDHITINAHRMIQNPPLHIVLYQPEIPANTGNIARLCGAAEMTLHLIHPLGFKVDDKHLKRAGLDYWKEIGVRHHADFDAFLRHRPPRARLLAFSRHAKDLYTKARVKEGDYLLFGRESEGLPGDILGRYPAYRVPIWGRVRSLNLSTTVGIVAYHFLHELGRFR